MIPKDWQKQLSTAYPKRKGQGWVKTGQQIEKHIKDGQDFDEMLIGANNYRKHCATSGEFVRMAQTFFGPNLWWLEFQDDDDDTNEITLDDTARDCGLERQEGEGDESLTRRIGISMTNRKYAK